MRSRGLLFIFIVVLFLLSLSLNAYAFDINISGADGYFKVKCYKQAFNLYDNYAKKCENELAEVKKDNYLVSSQHSEGDQLKKGSEILAKSFYCYYMAGNCLEKLGQKSDAANYYLKALYMTRARKTVTFVHALIGPKKTKNIVIDIAPKELNTVYDRLYFIGVDTRVLLEKIRAVGEIRRDLAVLIENGTDPARQDEYKARFAVCQKSESNLCVLLENFVIYEINRGNFDRFDVFVKYLNEFKPITHAVDGILNVASRVKENLASIIANSQNPASMPGIGDLKQKLAGLSEIIDYINANNK